MPSSIEELRNAIDDVDRRILALLAERLSLVLRVGEIKQKQAIDVYDPDRERELLDRLGDAAPPPLDSDVAKRVFRVIVRECRGQEETHVSGFPEPREP